MKINDDDIYPQLQMKVLIHLTLTLVATHEHFYMASSAPASLPPFVTLSSSLPMRH